MDKYADYLAKNLDVVDYSQYVIENISTQNYTDYIAENLDKTIKYSEYIAENLYGVKPNVKRKIRKDKIKKIFNE